MATRRRKTNPPQQAVQPHEYGRGIGWDVGDRAPANAYRATDVNGHATGPVLYERPTGRGVLIVTAGTQISQHTARLLDVPAEPEPVEPEPIDPDPED